MTDSEGLRHTWRNIAATFLKLGVTAYGGPAIMGIMQAELQEKRAWVSRERFLEGLSLVQNAIGSTGRPKVIRLVPREGAGISFLGRWDEGARKGTRRKGPNAVPSLDFDAVDADDNVRSRIRFVGHHSKCLGDRRFDVEIRINPEKQTRLQRSCRGSAWFPDARRVWGVPPDV